MSCKCNNNKDATIRVVRTETPDQTEARERFKMLYELWYEWVMSLNENERDNEVRDYFLQETGAGEQSPVLAMFEAFVGGLYKGFEFSEKGKDVHQIETT